MVAQVIIELWKRSDYSYSDFYWCKFEYLLSVFPTKFNEIDSTESCETDSLTSEDESEKNPNINMILWYVRQRKSSIIYKTYDFVKMIIFDESKYWTWKVKRKFQNVRLHGNFVPSVNLHFGTAKCFVTTSASRISSLAPSSDELRLILITICTIYSILSSFEFTQL